MSWSRFSNPRGKLQELYVEIYERDNQFPILTHIFRGKTRKEAMGYYRSHLKSDNFLRLCIENGQWRDVECRAVRYWR